MKNIKNIITLFFVGCFALALVSCKKDKDTENLAKETIFATFSLEGGAAIGWQKGTPFVEPGYTALEGTTDITNNVKIAGSVNANEYGKYTLEYSVLNSQGYPGSTSRTVYVQESTWPVNYAGSYALQPGGSNTASREKTISISQIAGGSAFRMSDSWWQASTIVVEFIDLGGGTFQVLPTNSNFGPIDNTSCTLTYDAPTETFTFTGGFASGGNVGITWRTIWKKSN